MKQLRAGLLAAFALAGVALADRPAGAPGTGSASGWTGWPRPNTAATNRPMPPASVTGIHKKHGLDATVRQGRPSVNPTQLLLAGRRDMAISCSSFTALNFVKENIPFRAVASTWQKDAAGLIRGWAGELPARQVRLQRQPDMPSFSPPATR